MGKNPFYSKMARDVRGRKKKANVKWYYFRCERAKRKKVNTLYVHTIIYSDERGLQNLLILLLSFFGFYFASDSREIQMFQPFHSHYFTKYVYIYFCTRIRLTCKGTPTHVSRFLGKSQKTEILDTWNFFIPVVIIVTVVTAALFNSTP